MFVFQVLQVQEESRDHDADGAQVRLGQLSTAGERGLRGHLLACAKEWACRSGTAGRVAKANHKPGLSYDGERLIQILLSYTVGIRQCYHIISTFSSKH